MKKVLSLVLALLMTASTASAVLADDVVAIAEEPVAVEEVAEEVEAGQYDKAIEFLANYKIFKGYNADDTGAEDLIQRYQMALFVARIATGWVEDEVWEDGPENWSEFSDIDVEPVNKYYGALSFANQKGIIEGYGNGKFGPTDSITYQNALTMVVRTLGYTGLDWPWGYIQKAVELGLTDGITGVAYTDELTRGEVAQIIYNALFAKMKDGSNLALKNFGIEFGWEKVVITASNINTFEKLADGKATNVEKELVEFKLLNNDGTLADDSYKALAADFNLDYTKHEDDLAVGNAYYVLFEKDADSALAEIVAVESLLVDVIENEGKTDDEGEEQEYAIQEFIADYTLVNKYTTDNYLNITASLKPELLVWDVVGGITEDVVDGYAIAIDWNTGDILGFEYKDGKAVDQNEDEKLDKEDYKVQWYFNTLLGRYYKEQYDKTSGELLGINYMTDEEFEEFYESTVIKAKKNYKGFTAITSIAKTAYATLEVFDTNLDGVADRALYESYKLGYFSNSTVKCCDKDRASYKLSSVNSLAVNAAKNGNDNEDVAIATVNELVEGVCDHGKAWFVEGYEPEVAYDEDGEATGYAAGYVIYSYDAETGAIKVVKNIDDGSDEDSYVATGVVRAYNVNKETITIGEEKLTMNYDELAGTGFYLVNKNAATKAAYTALLRDLFNQFVTYVVVDGEVVDIKACGADTDDVIVVESYAGLSSDGYIVVNGYSTADLEYAQFRLGSVDGWQEGDFYYYLNNYEGIERGMILSIASYDEENDLYYVEYCGGYEYDGQGNYEWYADVDADYVHISVEDGETRYADKRVWDEKEEEWSEASYVKMSSSDKYIIVPVYDNSRYATIKVYEGKLPEGAYIMGQLIKKTDDNTYVFVNAESNLGDTYDTGIVVLLDDTYYSASYNGEGAEDWYLLGAAEYEVNVYDILSGKFDVTKYATNKRYTEGKAYYTQGDVLTKDYAAGFSAGWAIVDRITQAYPDGDTYVANYIGNIFGYNEEADYAVIGLDKNEEEVYFDALYVTDKDAHKAAIEAMLLADMGADLDTKIRGDKVDAVTYRVINIDEDGLITSITDKVAGSKDGSKLTKFVEDGKYDKLSAFYVYDVEGKDIVIYVVVNDVDNGETVVAGEGSGVINALYGSDLNKDKTDDVAIVLEEGFEDDVQIIAKDIKYVTTLKNNVIDTAAITELTITFAGDYIDGNEDLDIEACDDHDTEEGFAYHFGNSGKTTYTCSADCLKDANVYAVVNGEQVAVEITEVKYDDVCKLIKGYTLKIAAEYFEEDAEILVVIPNELGTTYEYTLNVEIVEVGEFNGDEFENVVVAVEAAE